MPHHDLRTGNVLLSPPLSVSTVVPERTLHCNSTGVFKSKFHKNLDGLI